MKTPRKPKNARSQTFFAATLLVCAGGWYLFDVMFQPEKSRNLASSDAESSHALNSHITSPSFAKALNYPSSYPRPRVKKAVLKKAKRSPSAFVKKLESDRYRKNKVLSETQTAPDSDGNFKRVRIYDTKHAYRFIRVEQTIRQSEAALDESSARSGQASPGTVVSETISVATQIVVKLNPSYNEVEFKEWLSERNARILRPLRNENYFLLELGDSSNETYESVLASLKDHESVENAEENRMFFAN